MQAKESTEDACVESAWSIWERHSGMTRAEHDQFCRSMTLLKSLREGLEQLEVEGGTIGEVEQSILLNEVRSIESLTEDDEYPDCRDSPV